MSIVRTRSFPPWRRLFGTTALLLCCAGASSSDPVMPEPLESATDLSTLDLEQLMKVEIVFAGSKRAQRTREAASFVSVVTAAEIKEHDFRTLADVLKTLPSFYVSNDRNYSYLGVRGFARPGDYSSRVLLLVDGLRTNDNIYDQAYIGEEFVVDMDLVERIEVIRGPSAALYGSSAFFAVINVVTKQGRTLQGGEVATTAASYGTYAGRASYGNGFGTDGDVLVSASYSDSKGQRLFYPEYDSPSTNNGIADGADHESFLKLLANVDKGRFSLKAANISRDKGIPTGSFSSLFNDSRTHTVDGLTLASLGYSRSFTEGSALSTRVHAGRWDYKGRYAYDPGTIPNVDIAIGEWWGVDVDASHPLFTRHFLTVGAEYRDNFTQDQKNFDPEPYVLYIDLQNKSTRWGMFAQDEVKLLESLMLYAGMRFDRYETFGSATSPRVGLIYMPGTATTVKLLAGRAFRAPNEYELFFENALFRSNPELKPERIETLELIAQRFIGGGVQISASMFRNRLSALISQRVDANDNDRLVFENAEEIESKGVELGIDVNRGHGATGRLTYALQRTEDRATGIELTNSPRHMAKLQLWAPIAGKDLTAGLDAQYLSARQSLADNTAPGYLVTNVSLLAPRVFGSLAVSATVYNLFGTKYGNPGSEEHLQDIIEQDGRSFRVKTTWRY